MKKSSALFFQAVIVLVGIATLAFLFWEPHIEGRNAHSTAFEIYFKDPFLAYVYVGSIPFFVALYRAFWLAGFVKENGLFSERIVDALRAIKHCMMAFIGFVAGGAIFIIMFGDKDDRPAGIFMGFLVAFPSSVVIIVVATLARKLQNTLKESEGRLRR
jgi:hypothetical protein